MPPRKDECEYQCVPTPPGSLSNLMSHHDLSDLAPVVPADIKSRPTERSLLLI